MRGEGGSRTRTGLCPNGVQDRGRRRSAGLTKSAEGAGFEPAQVSPCTPLPTVPLDQPDTLLVRRERDSNPQHLAVLRDFEPRSSSCRTLSMVGLAGFEPAASRSRTECSTKLSHNPLVGTAGFEPAAARPPAACSSKLSYVPMRTPDRIRTCMPRLRRPLLIR
jgi:hypothetical protein